MTLTRKTLYILVALAMVVTMMLAALPVAPASAQGPILYGAAHQGPDGLSTLYSISTTSGVATPIGPIGFERVGGMDFAADGVLYATAERADGSDTPVLITIDIGTGAGTEVGPTGMTGAIGDISFRSDGVLFAFDALAANHQLYTVDTTTGAAALVGATGLLFSGGNGIAFSPADVLYHSNRENVHTLNQATGAHTVLGAPVYSPPADYDPCMNAKDYQPGTGILFASLNDQGGMDPAYENYLATLDTATLVVTIIGPTVDGLDAIAFAPPHPIDDGIAWLVANQNADGSWGAGWPVAQTALAVMKLEHHCVDPFDPACPYSVNISDGLDYIFARACSIPIVPQPAGNPDTNGNGIGVYFVSGACGNTNTRIYETGIALMAIVESNAPGRVVNVPASPVNGWTYGAVAQDVVDYLAFGQNDAGPARGGWGYWENQAGFSDNSNTGFAVLGLRYAEWGFGTLIPQFVKDELCFWIAFIQCTVAGPNYGGSGYSTGSGPCSMVNIYKTGHLLAEMEFAGGACGDQPAAIAYLIGHWNDTNTDPGWKGTGYPSDPSNYQAMYTTMVGLAAQGYVNPAMIDGINWLDEFDDAIVAQQQADGSWLAADYGDSILNTEWALLVLERVVPEEAELTIDMDTLTPSVAPGGQVDYEIRVANPGIVTAEGVAVGAALPGGFTYASTGSIIENSATRSSTDPTPGDNPAVWGYWEIRGGGSVTIPFTADVDFYIPDGTYDATAYAQGYNFAPIDDEGTVGEDPGTPPGQDPEPDEDVAVQTQRGVPTLSQWGLIGMGLLFAAFLIWSVRRRWVVSARES